MPDFVGLARIELGKIIERIVNDSESYKGHEFRADHFKAATESWAEDLFSRDPEPRNQRFHGIPDMAAKYILLAVHDRKSFDEMVSRVLPLPIDTYKGMNGHLCIIQVLGDDHNYSQMNDALNTDDLGEYLNPQRMNKLLDRRLAPIIDLLDHPAERLGPRF